MKHVLIIAVLFTITSCSSSAEEVDENTPVSEEKTEELNQIQEENVEIEQLDGELDSVLNEIESL